MKLLPVILCGGAGSRLWPVSRERHPKPFIRLADGQSLLQKAFLRGAHLPGVADMLVVTNRELYFKMEEEFQAVKPEGCAVSYLLEPVGRNTAPAIAAAAMVAARHYGDDVILLALAADHVIANEQGFTQAVRRAAALAQQGKLVTFGITPTSPETGYGYIETDGEKVRRFVEKPDFQTAVSYVQSGNFLWNSGMFCFTARAMLQQLQVHSPGVFAATQKCLQASSGAETAKCELDEKLFAAVPEISIDYAVMEKSDCVGVVACDVGWSDVGSWNALGELEPCDASGNVVSGEALLHDTKNCYIRSSDRMIGTVGLEDMIVIDTPDALLVAKKDRSQDVKHLFASLKQRGHDAHLTHRTVHRPWGTYTVLEEGSRFKIKRIVVKPGASLSLQMHHHRSEHWVVVTGTAKVRNGEREYLVAANESTFIPAGNHHRLTNPGVIDLVMIEVQSGDYLGEDDIVRLEDRYGRAKT